MIGYGVLKNRASCNPSWASTISGKQHAIWFGGDSLRSRATRRITPVRGPAPAPAPRRRPSPPAPLRLRVIALEAARITRQPTPNGVNERLGEDRRHVWLAPPHRSRSRRRGEPSRGTATPDPSRRTARCTNRHPRIASGAERTSSAAGAAGATMNHRKRACGPGLLQRLDTVEGSGFPIAPESSPCVTDPDRRIVCRRRSARKDAVRLRPRPRRHRPTLPQPARPSPSPSSHAVAPFRPDLLVGCECVHSLVLARRHLPRRDHPLRPRPRLGHQGRPRLQDQVRPPRRRGPRPPAPGRQLPARLRLPPRAPRPARPAPHPTATGPPAGRTLRPHPHRPPPAQPRRPSAAT